MSIAHPPIPTHTHRTEYAQPVLLPPSPASSVGTPYGADQTSFIDSESQLSQAAFERKLEETMKLNAPCGKELSADREPLLIVPAVPGQIQGAVDVKMVRVTERKLNPDEEKILFERVMTTLHAEVANLHQNEVFEQILRRGSKPALETQPSTNDIDALMRSMMGQRLIEDLQEPLHARDMSIQRDQKASSIFNGTMTIIGSKRSRDGTSRQTWDR